MNELKYPIGKFEYFGMKTKEERKETIESLLLIPFILRQEVEELNDEQLENTYREGGWTIRQVIHHLADAHANAYIRFKLALTEENPTIKPFNEALWAELSDSKKGDVKFSLDLLEAIHRRWDLTLNNMSNHDFEKTYYHPEHQRIITLDEALSLYEWHGHHHIAHITTVKARRGW